jgi:hypothetical protein
MVSEFIEEASKSTDFHVDSIDKQLDVIKLFAKNARSTENPSLVRLMIRIPTSSVV